jgi:hypothetical protein
MNEFKIIIDTAAAGDLDKAIKLLKEYETTAKQAQRESSKIGESFSKSNRGVQDELKKVTLEVNRLEQSSKSLDQTQQQSLSTLRKRQQELTKEAQEYAKAQKQAQQVTKTATATANGLLGQQVQRLKELRQAAKEAADPTTLQRYNEEIVKTSNQIKRLKADTGSLNREFDNSGASYNQLVQRNKELRQAMNQIPFNSTTGDLDKLKREFNSNTQALKRFDAELGQNFRNVGNYEEAIRGAISGLKGFGGGLASGIAGGGGLLGGAGAGLAAVPQFAAIAGVVQGLSGVSATFGELNDQLRITSSITDATGQELTDLVGQIRATSTVFQQDYNETLRATNVLIETFGKTGEESVELLNQALLRGANINGDFLDQISEYSIQFDRASLSAEQLLSVSIAAADQGIFSDKALDVIKEVTNRLGELPKATRDAIDGIGLSSDEIARALETGEKSISEVISLISRQLSTLPAQSARVGTAIADIFGGPGEDVGLPFLLRLQELNEEFDEGFRPLNAYEQKQSDILETQTELSKSQARLASTFSSLGGTIEIFTNEILAGLLDGLNEMFVLFTDNEEVIGRLGAEIQKNASIEQLEKQLENVNKELEDTSPLANGVATALAAFGIGAGSNFKQLSEEAELLKARIDELKGQEGGGGGGVEGLNESQKNQIELYRELVDATRDYKTALTSSEIIKLTQAQKDYEDQLKAIAKAAQEAATNLEKISGAGLQSGLDRVVNGDQGIATFLEAYEAAFSKSFLDPTKTIEEEYKDFADRIKEELESITDRNKELQEQQTEDTLREQERRRAIIEESFFAAADIARSVFDITSNVRDRELQQLEAQTEAQLEAVKGNEEAKIEIKKQAEREEAQIRRRQAEAERKLAIFNIALRTAQGIAGALASVPPNIPLSVIVGAIGAAQAAAVLSQPIPGFFKGTDRSPEGLAYVGERGQEAVIEKSGRAYLTPHTKSLTYLPKDSRVLTADETKQLMANSPELFKQSTRTPKSKAQQTSSHVQYQAVNIKNAIKEGFKEITLHQSVINERGIRRFTVRGGKRIESLNKRNSLGGNG